MSLEPQHLPLDYTAKGAGRGVHRVALLTAVATFPLIFMGGLVTSHHAGMSVPDWPNSYGYNMFLFPPNQWVGGILYEHTHRLMATVVGFCSVVLTLWAWGVAERDDRRRLILRATGAAALFTLAGGILFALRHGSMTAHARAAAEQALVGLGGTTAVLLAAFFARRREPSRAVRWLAASVLGVVIFQGMLGGLRVVLVQLDLAIVHASLAQAFFCFAALVAIVTSRWWENAARRRPAGGGRSLVVIGLATVCVIYLQLIVGATMRHFDAGLAIPDLPLAYGKWLPPTTAAGLAAINHVRAFEMNLDPVTLTQVWLHFGHRIGAVVVTAMALLFALKCLRRRNAKGLAVPAILLLGLLVTQLTLGVLTVLLRKPADIASTHVAVGALVLVTSFVMTLRAIRLFPLRRESSSSSRPLRAFESSRSLENENGNPAASSPLMNHANRN